jgi:DNA end-binding protein Ku
VGAEKPYLLLLRAMQRTGRAGIGRFVLRAKPHLVAIRPVDDVRGLQTLYFGDEVRSSAEISARLQGLRVSKRERELAEQLIATLDTEWSAGAYADEFREELLRMILQKAPTELEPEPIPTEGRVEELMDSLKRSVDQARERRRTASSKPRRRKAG